MLLLTHARGSGTMRAVEFRESDVAANDNRPVKPERPPSQRANIAALIVVALIGFALFWALSAIRSHDAVQNCIDSGRHDCVDDAPR